jgi:hypothetical protein
MKIIILGTLLSMASLAALADTGSDTNAAPDTQSVTIGATSPKYDVTQGKLPMSRDDFAEFTGSYDLANGKSLSLFTRGLKKYAVIGGEARHEIVATRANTFVSLDKQLKMTIARSENGDATGEVLIAQAQTQPQTAPEAQPVAKVSTHKSKQMVAHASQKKSKQHVLTSTQMVASR